MNDTLFELLTYFIVYSMAGWLMESIVRTVCEKKVINTGFLKGPFCPIYGIGSIIMIVFLSNFKSNLFVLFLLGFLVLSIWEYWVGFLLEKIFQTKYWDYSDQKWNIKGRVCIVNSLCWGVLGVIFIHVIHPFIQGQIANVDPFILKIIISSITLIFIIDTIISVIKVKSIKTTLEKVEQLNLQIKQKLEAIKEMNKDKTKLELTEGMKEAIEKLTDRKNKIIRRLYQRVYRLKKAFPAINTNEFTEILNKRIEMIKKEKEEKMKKRKEKKDGTRDLYN